MPAGTKQADGRMVPEPRMDVAHVARAVVFMASLPLDTQRLTMTIMATKMPLRRARLTAAPPRRPGLTADQIF